jgi:hypothetical protein
MNLKKFVLAAALTGLLAIPASAQIFSPGAPARTSAYTSAPTFFGDEEFSIDAFGSVTVAEGRLRRDHWRQDRLGLGVGMNYFHMRYFGIGADTYFGRLDVPDQISISGIFRWPIDQINLAPYAFGGGA